MVAVELRHLDHDLGRRLSGRHLVDVLRSPIQRPHDIREHASADTAGQAEAQEALVERLTASSVCEVRALEQPGHLSRRHGASPTAELEGLALLLSRSRSPFGLQ